MVYWEWSDIRISLYLDHYMTRYFAVFEEQRILYSTLWNGPKTMNQPMGHMFAK